ncbi:O-antigen ligase family protein [uncultured Friedmanniella sp.]|uniref:O-antigen ligase family protein n=1 Tax=uncultured Friedmanniella sp. TaxID=335381 RepID=UPI0035CABE13
MLYAWAGALLLIPSTLLFAPLGAAGTPAQILGLVAGLWWLGVQLNRSQHVIQPSIPTRSAMLAFALAMLFSYVSAARRPVEALEVSSADRGVILVASWAGLMLLTTDGVVSRHHLLRLLRFLVTCMALVGILGVVQYVTHTSYVDQLAIPGLSTHQTLGSVYDRNGFARTAGTATHPIEFGVVLTMVLPIALHFAFTDVHRSRFARLAPVVAICAALPLTMSRSAFLGLAVVLAVLLPSWSPPRRRLAYVAVIAGLGAVYLLLPGVLGTMVRLFTGISEDDSARSRTDSYGLAFEFIRQHPVFGRGISTFLPSYRILDNQYLGLLIETGVVGLVAFLALLATTLVVAQKMSRALPDPTDRSLARSLMATIASAALACATFDAFGFPQVSGMLFFAIGAVGSLFRLSGFVLTESLPGQVRVDLDFSSTRPSFPHPGRTGDECRTARVRGHGDNRATSAAATRSADEWDWSLPEEPGGWNDLIVIAAGVSWDDPWMSEKHLALALSERVPVLYVDPPVSTLTWLRKPHLRSRPLSSSVRVVLPGLARVTPVSLPGVTRPVLREVARLMTRRAIRRAVHRLGAARVDAIVAASFDDVLNSSRARLRVLWGTDDWVAGADLMGIPVERLEQEESRQLSNADLIMGVSQQLAERWAAPGRAVHIFPNGCDARALARTSSDSPADDVTLPRPTAVFLGHISERIDIQILQAVADAGVNLLLVGPLALTSSLEGFESLTARPNVQWTGPRPFPDLPRYLAAASVGLTPYVTSPFNQGSYPLKTIEYLAAGLDVVSTDLPAARALPDGLVHIASTPAAFAALTAHLARNPTGPERRRAGQTFAQDHSWEARASQFLGLIGHPASLVSK